MLGMSRREKSYVSPFPPETEDMNPKLVESRQSFGHTQPTALVTANMLQHHWEDVFYAKKPFVYRRMTLDGGCI